MTRNPGDGRAIVHAGGATSLLFVTDPAEINRLQRLAVQDTRLGIPLLFGFDVIHGLRTILPVPIAMAASWDPDTIERGQSMAAREAVPAGSTGRSRRWSTSPAIPLGPDHRGAGEDPYLGAAVAAAQVRGFQGERARTRPSASSPGPSTSPATARRSAVATTTRSTCPTRSSGTCTCRRSRRRSTPVPAT